jgi:hypothetical protein
MPTPTLRIKLVGYLPECERSIQARAGEQGGTKRSRAEGFREPEPVPNSRVPMQPFDMAGTRRKRDRDGYRRLPRGRETPLARFSDAKLPTRRHA